MDYWCLLAARTQVACHIPLCCRRSNECRRPPRYSRCGGKAASRCEQLTSISRSSGGRNGGLHPSRETRKLGTGCDPPPRGVPEDFISAIAESSDSAAVYPGTGTQTASYNDLNQLTDLSGQAFGYDANGNLTSDGQRTYSWDAENRLVGIAYPGQPGKATAFTYDGSSRRVAISSTPAGGGSATTTSYIWCGSSLCQARDASNAPVREYFGEGEFVPGTPGQPYYYGTDQIGSVRRAFAGAGNAPAYSYDPYGNALQATAPVTDFGYAGMFYNADSGLYLTQYRAYDPLAGRWLSRDPIGEASDPAGNLYAYVQGNPVSYVDPFGLDVYPADFYGPLLPGDCYSPIPMHPPGADVDANMQEAANMFPDPWAFRNAVKNKGKWDYKQQGSQYQNFGNFNYGAAGNAWGFPGTYLLKKAGEAQIVAGTSRPEWQPLNGIVAPYGDDPNDQKWIQRGINYATNGGQAGCTCK
jgi:RHS repeat-associated protein